MQMKIVRAVAKLTNWTFTACEWLAHLIVVVIIMWVIYFLVSGKWALE